MVTFEGYDPDTVVGFCFLVPGVEERGGEEGFVGIDDAFFAEGEFVVGMYSSVCKVIEDWQSDLNVSFCVSLEEKQVVVVFLVEYGQVAEAGRATVENWMGGWEDREDLCQRSGGLVRG